MKKIRLLIIIHILFQSCSNDTDQGNNNLEPSQNEEIIKFEKDVGNIKTPVRQTNDGGYIVAGGKDGQAWLMKLDKYGNEEWQNTYSLGDFGYTRSVVQTSNGGYLYSSYEGILKVDSNGVEEWKNESKTIGAFPYYEDAIEHSNGNFYAVGGPSGGQGQIVKFDPTGSVLKRKFYGSDCEDDIFRSIAETKDGMLIVAGEKSHGNQYYDCAFNFMYYKDFWILKLNKNGGVIWQKTYGSAFLEQADDIVVTEEGGFGVIGNKCDHGYNIGSCGATAGVLFMSLNANGELLEQKEWSGLNFIERLPYFSITTTEYGGFAWTAEHKSKGTWIHKFGQYESSISVYPGGLGGFDIHRTSDNGFIIGTWDGFIFKTDNELNYENSSDN